MEQKVFSKFNIYDQIGYLMVGAIALLVLVFNGAYFFKLAIPLFDINTFLVWFIIVYFLGHLIQGVANVISDIQWLQFLMPENKEDFNKQEKEILEHAKTYFGLEKQDESKLWSFCYMFSNAKDITGQVQAFNAYYSLYRGWLVIFILESLFLFGFLFVIFNLEKILLLLASVFLAFIFYRRSKRFWEYTKDKVFQTFVIVKKLNV